IGYRVQGRSWMYTDVVARPRELRARHSVQNQWDLLDAIHVDGSRNGGWPEGAADPARDAVDMPVDPAADGAIERRLLDAGITPAHDLIVAHVSAGNPFRRWPEPAFVEVLVRLARGGPMRRIIEIGRASCKEREGC